MTVTADPQTKVYGSANPTFTGSITGIKNSDAITATYSSSADSTSPVGTYAIVPVLSGTALSNYATPTVTNGTLAVTPKLLTGSVTVGDKIYDGTTNATVMAVLCPVLSILMR